jgi:hypothetical protein
VRRAARGALFARPAGASDWTRLWSAPQAVGTWAFGDGGWLYATIGDDPERIQLVAVSPAGTMTALTGPSSPDVAAWPYQVAGNGRAVVANLADQMARLRHGAIVSQTCEGEHCPGDPPPEQSTWPLNGLRAVDRRGLPLVDRRNHAGRLVRLAPQGARALL